MGDSWRTRSNCSTAPGCTQVEARSEALRRCPLLSWVKSRARRALQRIAAAEFVLAQVALDHQDAVAGQRGAVRLPLSPKKRIREAAAAVFQLHEGLRVAARACRPPGRRPPPPSAGASPCAPRWPRLLQTVEAGTGRPTRPFSSARYGSIGWPAEIMPRVSRSPCSFCASGQGGQHLAAGCDPDAPLPPMRGRGTCPPCGIAVARDLLGRLQHLRQLRHQRGPIDASVSIAPACTSASSVRLLGPAATRLQKSSRSANEHAVPFAARLWTSSRCTRDRRPSPTEPSP